MKLAARILVLLLLFIVIAFFFLRPRTSLRSPTLVFLPPTERLDSSNFLKNFTTRVLLRFYKPESAVVSADIFSHTNLTGVSVGRIIGRTALAETNGTMVWSLSPVEATKLETQLKSQEGTERISSPRILTSEFATGTMFIGQITPVNGTNVEVGISLSVLPRVKPSRTELTFAFSWTEALTNNANAGGTYIRTNASLAARAEGLKDRRLFILSDAQQGHPSVCLFIKAESATNGSSSSPSTAPTSVDLQH